MRLSLKHITDSLCRVAAAIAITAMLGSVVSCSSHDEPSISNPVEPEVETVFLALDITPLENTAARHESRANTVDSDNFFELPALRCETLGSLRVIIVSKATGIIEANRYVAVNAEGLPIGDNLIFRTTPGAKLVYIFGNEESLPESTRELLESNRADTPVTGLDDITLSRHDSDSPLYDFRAPAYDGYSRVPMSECWEVNVEKESVGGRYQQAALFITRAVTKFSFRIKLSEDFQAVPVDKITDIVINGIGSSEYLLPRNTVYSPAKGTPSTNPYEGRWITQFSTPAANNPAVADTFRLATPVNLRNLADGHDFTYAPAIYLPESTAPAGGFTCQLKYDKAGLTFPVELPNLEQLPRNTHAVIDITVGNDFQMMLNVEVLPWNSETYEYDYTTNIGIPADGYLTFDAGTYRNLNKQTAQLLLDYPKPVRARFGISTPIGATWDAYLITTGGEEDAIRFRSVDATGTYTYTTHISGAVGNARNIIDITSVMAPGSSTRTARLQITVTLPGGVTIPVNILSNKEYGTNEYMTIVQNPQ